MVCTQEDHTQILTYKAIKLSKELEAPSPVEVVLQYLISPDLGQLSEEAIIFGLLSTILRTVGIGEEREKERESILRLPLCITLSSHALLPLGQIESEFLGNENMLHYNVPVLR